jgi:ATP-binding cassette subfamily B multidrug efflux pump
LSDNKRTGMGSTFSESTVADMSEAAVVRRLWKYLRPYRGMFFLSLLLLPAISAVELLQPYLLQIAIDQYIVPRDLSGFHLVVLAFAACVLSQGILQFTQVWVMQTAGQRALRDLRQAVFDHVQSLSVAFFQRQPLGRLMARLTTDIESLQEALASGMVSMIGDLFTLTAIVVILLWKDWRFALASFVVVPFLLALTAVFRHFMRKAFREVRTKVSRLYSHLQESIAGMQVIQLFVRETISGDEYRKINGEYRDANFMAIRFDALLYAVVEAVGSVTVGVIIWYGSGAVVRDVVTLGVLVAFIEYMQKFFVPIRDLAQKYNFLQAAIVASERVFELLDETDRLPVVAAPLAIDDGPLEIEFDNVSFSYLPGEPVLKNISLRIRPAEKIALVGHTGSGKSTIIQLLLRLRDPDSGVIRVNGIDVRDLDPIAYRRRFAVVMQDCFLFQGTIRQNITLDDPEVDDAAVLEAAKSAHVERLAARYADGLEHLVGERGQHLSSGERQLVSFARAVAHRPDILVLDEATANVDSETEALIQDAVESMMSRQTSVVIAHRLSTIQNANRIIVLHRGEILEDGTHQQLLAAGGHYSTLHRLQYREAS